ncbi:hypothetical protein [Methyloceanibacter sp. wino2]|uniref:DUF6998 domain-containing protein n=1 Tax=Methyloceanibacter sp. wino2 TaxID=2170729 RepID=UPI00131EDCDB|nr:hypothetical protein [Methyloceanibacter sp. wino2]
MTFDPVEAKQLVEQLFRITDKLQEMTKRPFTPDGHLVGSLGEVLAKSAYDLELTDPSTKACDAWTKDGQRVEIKATFNNRVAFRDHDADFQPEKCLVLRLGRDAGFEEIYNGPMSPIVERLSSRKLPSNGQRQITLAQLLELNKKVNDADRLRRKTTEAK